MARGYNIELKNTRPILTIQGKGLQNEPLILEWITHY